MPNYLKLTAQYTYSGYQPEKHNLYRISIQLRLNGFSFVIVNPENTELLKLSEYAFASSNGSIESQWDILHDEVLKFLDENAFMGQKFQNARIVLDHKDFNFLPKAFYKTDQIHQQFSFSQDIHYKHYISSHEIVGSDRMIYYSIPQRINNLIQDYFEGAPIYHIDHVFQHEVLKLHKNKKRPSTMYVYVSNRDFHILVMSKEEVLFQNAFNFTSKEDFIYFILLTYDQLEMNPEEDPIYLLGEISRSSALYNICWQYVRHVKLLNDYTDMIIGNDFDQMSVHQYFLLIHSSICEL